MRKFEEFTLRANPALRKTPRVAIQTRGNMSLNYTAFMALGEPEAIVFFYDKESKVVGLKPVPVETRHAYPVRRQQGSKSFLVGAQSFCKYYGIDVSQTRVFVPQLEDGMLVFELDTGIALPTRKRSKGTSTKSEKEDEKEGELAFS